MRWPTLAAVASLLLAAPAAGTETCEEAQEDCLENCHVDFGMEAKRVELTRCVTACDRKLANCAELRQEEKRNKFRMRDPDAEKRRGPPPDVRPYEETKGHDARPVPYEDFEEGTPRTQPAPPRAQPRKGEEGGAPPAKVDRPKKGDEPPKSSGEKAKKGEKDKPLSEDDWAK